MTMSVTTALWILAITVAIQVFKVDAADVVSLPGLGTIRGFSRTVLTGKMAEIFQGVPFAKPPIGNLRFKAPVGVDPWSGELNATKAQIFCPQPDFFNRSKVVGAEDCLYLNVYTPKVSISALLPVMVWVHGGGYVIGSGSQYNGEMLAVKYNVVVVTINYRLGTLGFFNIPGTRTKGNFGILDQIAALKWVRKYIEVFRGDPNKVTIFGESAGAGSVTLLMLSPLAKGLFSRVIAESGSPTCYWSIGKTKNTTYSTEFGSKLGCTNIATMTECLRGKTWRDIMHGQAALESSHPMTRPAVDGDVFIELPRDQVNMNKLPVSSVELLIGFNKDEGTMFVPVLPSWNQQTFNTLVRNTAKWQYDSQVDIVENAVSYVYPHNSQTSDYMKFSLGYNDFVADFTFVQCIVDFAQAWSKIVTKTYLYEFSYLPKYRRMPSWMVAHGIELDFVFGKPLYPPNHPGYTGLYLSNYTSNDTVVSEKIMTMWTDFAKSGNPESNWPTYNNSTQQYRKIDFQTETMSKVKPHRMAFWHKFIPRIVKLASQSSPTPTQITKPCNKTNQGTALKIPTKLLLISLLALIIFDKFLHL